MSDACQPSLRYGGSTVRPDVPDGTRIALISSGPVLADTVMTDVMAVPGIGDERLRPVDHPFVAVELGLRPGGAGVRPRLRLGEAEGSKGAPRQQVGQPARLLLIRPERCDGVDPEPDRSLEGDPHRLIDSAHLLDRYTEAGEIAAASADLLGKRQTEETEVSHLVHHVERQMVVSIPSSSVGCDLGFRELPHHLAEHLVLLRKLEVHPVLLVDATVSEILRRPYQPAGVER